MRVLHVEDDFRDADLTQRALRKTAPHILLEQVFTIKEGLARLDRLPSEKVEAAREVLAALARALEDTVDPQP